MSFLSKLRLPISTSSMAQISLMGTWGCGKTTLLALLDLFCMDYANRPENKNKFKYMVYEINQGVRSSASYLRQGKFPESSQPGFNYEAVADMKFLSPLGEKVVRIPFVELPGEDLIQLIERLDRSSRSNKDYKRLSNTDYKTLYEKILQANGFILPVSAPRALAVQGVPDMEAEPEGVHDDPDVNAQGIFQKIIEFKREYGQPIPRGVALVFTKYDKCKDYLQAHGMPLTDEKGLPLKENILDFMRKYFPATLSMLNFFDLDKVLFLPIWVFEDQNEPGRIVVNERTNRPYFNELGVEMLVNWVKSF